MESKRTSAARAAKQLAPARPSLLDLARKREVGATVVPLGKFVMLALYIWI